MPSWLKPDTLDTAFLIIILAIAKFIGDSLAIFTRWLDRKMNGSDK